MLEHMREYIKAQTKIVRISLQAKKRQWMDTQCDQSHLHFNRLALDDGSVTREQSVLNELWSAHWLKHFSAAVSLSHSFYNTQLSGCLHEDIAADIQELAWKSPSHRPVQLLYLEGLYGVRCDYDEVNTMHAYIHCHTGVPESCSSQVSAALAPVGALLKDHHANKEHASSMRFDERKAHSRDDKVHLRLHFGRLKTEFCPMASRFRRHQPWDWMHRRIINIVDTYKYLV
eukprot:2896795-Amphidinium_carterae.1